MFIKKNARRTRPNIKSPKYLSKEIIAAIQNNDVSRLKSLREGGANFNISDKDGNTVFHLPIQNHASESTLDTFKYLLTLDNVSKEEFNIHSRTPLLETFDATNGENYAICLIESGCFIDHVGPEGTTLHMAVCKNWKNVAELLIERGISIDYQNEDGETALHLAVKKRYIDIIWMLLFFGANPNIRSLDYSVYADTYIYMYSTFFDWVVKQTATHQALEVFLDDQFYCYNRDFSLHTFIEAMENESSIFYTLLETTFDVNYTYDELKTLSRRFFLLNSKMLQIFTQEFGYILEEMFNRCCLDDLFDCPDPYYLNNYSENVFMLLESGVSDTFVEKINTSNLPILTTLIESFAESKELSDLLCQVLCCMLSYGVDLTADALNALYLSVGYSPMFKVMLHMDIKDMNRSILKKRVFPHILYDVNMSVDSVISGSYDQPTVYKISQYFTLPKYKLFQQNPVPTLLELARNRAREYIITKFKIKNSRHFYTVLRMLPIAEIHKKIISFEVKLYL